MGKRVAIDIRKVPDDVRGLVDADARARGESRETVITRALASYYRLGWEPSGYPYIEPSDTDHWNIRVPQVVKDALKRDATERGGTMTGCILFAIRDHYGLPNEPPARRSPGGLDPALVEDATRRHLNGESLRSLSRSYGVKRETLTRAIRGEAAGKGRAA